MRRRRVRWPDDANLLGPYSRYVERKDRAVLATLRDLHADGACPIYLDMVAAWVTLEHESPQTRNRNAAAVGNSLNRLQGRELVDSELLGARRIYVPL